MELLTTIALRQSVRRFAPGSVPLHICAELLAAAVLAPSPHGRQPWQFIVLESSAARETLISAMAVEWRQQLAQDSIDVAHINARVEASTQRIRSAPLLIMPCVDCAVLDAYPDNHRHHAEYLMAVQSIGCAIQNMLLRAVDLGYDAGWMCAPLFCPEHVQTALTLPKTTIPQALITVGIAHTQPKRRSKRDHTKLTQYR
jgi:F420 biosynthesis protein FbiB-like protein